MPQWFSKLAQKKNYMGLKKNSGVFGAQETGKKSIGGGWGAVGGFQVCFFSAHTPPNNWFLQLRRVFSWVVIKKLSGFPELSLFGDF